MMKWKFTYKELSLLIGILVAVIILVTLWVKPVSTESGEVSDKPVKEFVAKPAAKILFRKTFVLVTEILR